MVAKRDEDKTGRRIMFNRFHMLKQWNDVCLLIRIYLSNMQEERRMTEKTNSFH